MNLFILSLIQCEIAQFMMDKHVSKILLEAVQMLCSCKRILDPDDAVNEQIYKLAHLLSVLLAFGLFLINSLYGIIFGKLNSFILYSFFCGVSYKKLGTELLLTSILYIICSK